MRARLLAAFLCLVPLGAAAQEGAPVIQYRGGVVAGPPPSAADLAAFEAFGGKEGLVRLARDLMAAIMTDPRARPPFAKLSQARRDQIEARLADQFCELLGGPCTYRGPKMKNIHRGLGFTMADFTAVVEDLQAAMDRNNVPFRAQNRLLAKLAPMHRDIVEK
jgi:hemoglobin